MHSKKRIAFNAVRFLAIGAILYAICRYVYANLHELKDLELTFSWPPLALSVLLNLLFVFNLSLIWTFITQKNDCNLPLGRSVVYWFYSELGKYVPGKVLLVAGRIYPYHREGKSKLLVALSFSIEHICSFLASAFIVLLSMLFADIPMLRSYRLPACIVSVVLILAVHPRSLQYLANLARRLTGKEKITLSIGYLDIVEITALYLLNYALLGLAFYFLVASIYDISIAHVLFLAGANALAGIVGIMSLFAPSGIGVREGILTVTLGCILPKALAGIIAIVARLWTTAAEMLLILLAFLYARTRWRDRPSVTQNGASPDGRS